MVVGRGGAGLVSLRDVSDLQACGRAAGVMRDAYGWDRIVLHCDELFLYTGFLKLAILLRFFFFLSDTLDGFEISRSMGVCAIGDGESSRLTGAWFKSSHAQNTSSQPAPARTPPSYPSPEPSRRSAARWPRSS